MVLSYFFFIWIYQYTSKFTSLKPAKTIIKHLLGNYILELGTEQMIGLIYPSSMINKSNPDALFITTG